MHARVSGSACLDNVGHRLEGMEKAISTLLINLELNEA
jgi:hypothetical protein